MRVVSIGEIQLGPVFILFVPKINVFRNAPLCLGGAASMCGAGFQYPGTDIYIVYRFRNKTPL